MSLSANMLKGVARLVVAYGDRTMLYGGNPHYKIVHEIAETQDESSGNNTFEATDSLSSAVVL